MLSNKDKVTLWIFVLGAYGPILVAFFYFNTINEFILTGLLYTFFVANMQTSQRYEDYLLRQSKIQEFHNLQKKFHRGSRNNMMAALIMAGITLGVIMFFAKSLII